MGRVTKRKFRASQVRSRKGKTVTAVEHALVMKYAKACMRELSKKKYELPGMLQPLTVKTKASNQRSYGDSHSITIDVWSYRQGESFFYEYRAIQKSPIIGAIKGATPEACLLALVAHEVAHHVHWRYRNYLPRHIKRKDQKPHGKAWQTLYRYLRVALVNPLANEVSGARIGDTLLTPFGRVRSVTPDQMQEVEIIFD